MYVRPLCEIRSLILHPLLTALSPWFVKYSVKKAAISKVLPCQLHGAYFSVNHLYVHLHEIKLP